MSSESELSAEPDHETGKQRKTKAVGAVRRIGVNALSLLTGDVLNRGVTFVIYALVGRYIGTYAFGQLTIALMLLYSFQVLSSIGMPILISRDVAKRPEDDGKYLINATAITFVGSILGYAALGVFTLLSGYAEETVPIIMLIGLSLLPLTLTLNLDAILRAHERMHLVLWAALPVNLGKWIGAVVLMRSGHGVLSIAWLILAGHVVNLLIHSVVVYTILSSKPRGLSLSFSKQLIRKAWKFFGLDAFVAFSASVNFVVLSWFTGETAVGIFGAAVQLLLPPNITLQAIIASVFPIMCRRADQGGEDSRRLLLLMLEVLVFLAVPGCVLLWFCAAPLVEWIYQGKGFQDSVILVQVMIPSLMLRAISRVTGQVLISHGREGVNLRIVAIDLAFNFVLAIALIYPFGIYGAAVAYLATTLLDCCLHVYAARSLFKDVGASPVSTKFVILKETVIASIVMAIVLRMLGAQGFFSYFVVGSVVFLGCMVIMSVMTNGWGISFRERFFLPLAEK